MAHPYAYAHQMSFAEDSPSGSIISKAGQDAHFCGFEQLDGSIAFKNIRQYPGGMNMGLRGYDSREYCRENPVFLSTEEMKTQGINAIVFPSTNDGFNWSELSKDDYRASELRSAEKDVDINGRVPGSQFGNGTVANKRTYGLASSQSAADSLSQMPLDFGASFSRQLKAGIEAARKVLSRDQEQVSTPEPPGA